MGDRAHIRLVILVACACLLTLLALSPGPKGRWPAGVAAQNGLTPTPALPSVLEAPLNEAVATRLWVELQNADYRRQWDTIPGKGVFYRGQSPHGDWLTAYLSPGLTEEIRLRPGLLPNAATIVLENHGPDRTLRFVSVMQKQPGYNPGHNDWFWAEYDPDGTVQVAGRVPGCVACHGGVWSNDYVYSFPVAVLNPSLPNPGWAAGTPPATPEPSLGPLASAGAASVERFGCLLCHTVDGSASLGPTFFGLYGSNVTLMDGTVVMADEDYLRRSILEAHQEVREGFPPALMPDYSGRMPPGELDAIVEYLKSLSGAGSGIPTPPASGR